MRKKRDWGYNLLSFYNTKNDINVKNCKKLSNLFEPIITLTLKLVVFYSTLQTLFFGTLKVNVTYLINHSIKPASIFKAY